MEKQALFVLLVSVFLTSCALAPGMHYDKSDDSDFENFQKVELDSSILNQDFLASNGDSSPTVSPELLKYQPAEYKIGVYDVIQVNLWGHPEFNLSNLNRNTSGPAPESMGFGKFVDTQGEVFIPFAGPVVVAGLTVGEARELITKELSKYIESPQVDVYVIEYGSKSYSVAGHVMEPGLKPIRSKPITIIDAIGIAGGFSNTANRGDITLVRDGVSHNLDLVKLTMTNDPAIFNLYIKPDDVIQVGDNKENRVFVVGEVRKPQPVDYTSSGLTLTAALGEVGGVDPLYSSGDSIYIIRLVEEQDDKLVPTLFQLKGRSPLAFAIADKFLLQPKDVVFVGASAITRWNRVISQMFPSFDFFTQTRRLTVE